MRAYRKVNGKYTCLIEPGTMYYLRLDLAGQNADRIQDPSHVVSTPRSNAAKSEEVIIAFPGREVRRAVYTLC
jgi:hypothetical protein